MRAFSLSRWAFVCLGLVSFTAACEDATPPQFADPAVLAAELQQVNDAFDTPVISSFSVMSEDMAPAAPGGAAVLLRAATPERFLNPAQPQNRSIAAAEGLRTMAQSFTGPARGPLIPDQYYGLSFEWDVLSASYVQSQTPNGPANGIRFYLYAIDPLTRLPAEPLNIVGYVDLTDESDVATYALQAVVRNAAETATFLDYALSVTPGPSSFTANAVGYISNGAQGTVLRRLDFDIAFAATGSATALDASADATLELANSSVSLEVHDDAHFTETSFTFSRDFRLHRPGEVVAVVGSLTFTETGPETYSVNGTVTIRINGEGFVTITATGNTVQTDRELTEAEQLVVLRLLEAVDDVWDCIEDLFDPVEHFADA
jgi:hypothetical protein